MAMVIKSPKGDKMISNWTDLLSFLGGNSGQTAATGAGGAGAPVKQATLPVAQNTAPVVAAGTPTKVPAATDEGIFGKALGSIKEHPELTAIILDYLGTSLAGRKEGNIASGLGTLLGKSSLNEKALKAIENKRTTEQENLIKTITDLIGGKAPNAGSFTPAGLTGVNSVRIKPNAQGGTNHQIDFDVKNESNATADGENSLLEKPKNLNFPKP